MFDFYAIGRLKILDVADRLKIQYSGHGSWRMALCFCHDDHTPSLGINPAHNRWKCFTCGKGGSLIDLVMEHENISFADACRWLEREFYLTDSTYRPSRTIKPKPMISNSSQPIIPMTSDYLSDTVLDLFAGTGNEFSRALVQNRILTPEQMDNASAAYRLSTYDDHVIFWQIDPEGHIRDGKVMCYEPDAHRSHTSTPVSVSWLLKSRNQLGKDWRSQHCLFGLHLLSKADANGTSPIIAVVESEKTAIICSQLIPTFAPDATQQPRPVIWLATGGLNLLSVQSLLPLKGRRFILFPDTDSSGNTFQQWSTVAQDAAKQLGHPVTVSDILERHANPDQKARKIDIADLITER